MGWFTAAVCVGLVVAVCSVHRPNSLIQEGQSEPRTGSKEEGSKMDMEDMIDMAKILGKNYLGDEGVSRIEKLGKKMIGGGIDVLGFITKALNDLPKEEL